MRILFTRFPLESAKGGAENQTMWLAAGLRDRGHTVTFLGSCPVLSETFAAAGFEAVSLDIGEPPVTMFGAISFLWRRRAMLAKLRAAIEAMPTPPDAVCMLSLSEKILLTDWLSSRGIKVLWIEHDRVGRWLRSNPWLSELKTVSAKATIVCVSELSRRLYIDLGFDPERVITIPNGIPAPQTSYSTHPDRPGLHVGCIARLSPEKGVDRLIHAIADLPEITLRIVGSGPEATYLRTLIAEDERRIGLPRITLQSSAPDLDVFYASIDACVLPSADHDPFGLVAAEAMARGIPTIVTDACGIAGYLKDGEDALVVPAGSPDGLAAALRRLTDSFFREKLGKAGAETARKRFAVSTMVDGYESALKP